MKKLPVLVFVVLFLVVLPCFGQEKQPNASPQCSQKSGLVTNEIVELLAEHNKIRSELKIPLLKWDCDLAADAQAWADEGVYTHGTADDYNENLYASSNKDIPAKTAVSRWMTEQNNYNAVKKQCAAGKICQHYFHIVSKKAQKLGCGIIRRNIGTNRNAFLVCYYSPGLKVGESPF